MNSAEYLTLDDVAATLRVTNKTARNYIQRGGLPSYHLPKGIRIDRADLAAWMQDRYKNPMQSTARQ